MRLHHIGTVVDDLVSHGRAYQDYLGLQAESDIIEDPIQRVRLQFWRDPNGNLIELIEPNSADSPVRKALQKGGGLNHLCYEVEDIEQQVRTSIERGAIAATGLNPAVAFAGRRVTFLFFPKLSLVEFVEAPKG